LTKELTIDYVDVSSLEFGEFTRLIDGKLTINKEELMNLVNKSVFDYFDIKIVSPGESVRILSLHDCTQPRCKVDDPDTSYPGIWGKLAPAGEGRTVALRGVLVSEIYYPKANVKWYLDMCEPCSNYSYYAKHHHVIIDAKPAKFISDLSYAEALKHAALTINVHLARLAIGMKPDKTEVFSNKVLEGPEYDSLPRVAYLCIHLASFDTWNFLYYGQSALGYLPTVVHPTEILDGAMIYRYWEFTYALQNEPYIKELFSRHGKDLIFTGVVFANNVMRIDDKNAMTMLAASLCKNTLNADCVMVNKSGMGHSQLDASMAYNWCEKLGMPATLNLSGVSNDAPGDMLIISDPKVDAIVNSGRDFVLKHPKVERLIAEDAIMPNLVGIDPWGPFEHTTSCAYAGIFGQLGDFYTTTDADINWNTK